MTEQERETEREPGREGSHGSQLLFYSMIVHSEQGMHLGYRGKDRRGKSRREERKEKREDRREERRGEKTK